MLPSLERRPLQIPPSASSGRGPGEGIASRVWRPWGRKQPTPQPLTNKGNRRVGRRLRADKFHGSQITHSGDNSHCHRHKSGGVGEQGTLLPRELEPLRCSLVWVLALPPHGQLQLQANQLLRGGGARRLLPPVRWQLQGPQHPRGIWWQRCVRVLCQVCLLWPGKRPGGGLWWRQLQQQLLLWGWPGRRWPPLRKRKGNHAKPERSPGLLPGESACAGRGKL